MKQRRVRVQTDPDQLVVVPAEGAAPLLFRRSDGRVALEGPWTAPAEGQPLPAASLVVLDTGRTLSRVIDLPDAENAKLEAALQLQVSTLQMGTIPTWRTAMALLPRAEDGEGRTGLVVEWPTSDTPVVAGLRELPPEGDPLFASDLACLAALLESGAHGPLVALHPDRTVMAFGVRMGARRLLRITRLDPADWNNASEVAVVESLVRAGADGATASNLLEGLREAIASADQGVFGSTEADRDRLAMDLGVETDAAWWREHGLALGAATAWFGTLRGLVSLREQPAGERAGPWGEALNRLSDRQTAARLVLAALVGLAVLPPAIAGLRLLMLHWKVGDLASLERAIQAHRQRVSLYGELQRRAWPMGKLLGDLASVTPEGIEWENIQLSQDRNVSITGSAKPHDGLDGSEVILRMERQMVDSRVFDRVQKKWDPPDAKGSTGFTLSAVVARPTVRPSYPADQDFAKRTLAERRYGPQKSEETAPEPEQPRASTAAAAPPSAADLPPTGDLETPSAAVAVAASAEPAQPAPAAEAATEERADASAGKGMRRSVPSGTSGGLARRSERTPGSSDSTVPVPPPITDEQIAAMTRTEASEAASRVAKARREASVDAATQARLKSEFEKLMLRSRTNP